MITQEERNHYFAGLRATAQAIEDSGLEGALFGGDTGESVAGPLTKR